jgi:hypothetical protein
MIKKRLKKRAKKVRGLMPENAKERAITTLNPLAENQQPALTDENVPRITNETIAEHREEVLKGARKFIYPLSHSKHRIVLITSSIVIIAVIALLSYCAMGLYKYYQYNSFLYRVTQVVPFPVARIGNTLIDYENYLFELRHYVHYYQTQQQDLFGGQNQVNAYRQQVLDNVINEAYVKKLAAANNVKVSDKEVEERVEVVRSQNRLGSNDKVFSDVLRDYWGWSISDFKRALHKQILAEKLAAKMDTGAQAKAQETLTKIRQGGDFEKLGGKDYGFDITKTNPNVPPQVVDALFKLKAGQTSGVVVASPVQAGQPTTLEIVKVIENDGNTINAQHISFKLNDVMGYIKDLKAKQPPTIYVKF